MHVFKVVFSMLLSLLLACHTEAPLKVISNLPEELHEVSGIVLDKNNNILWMVNDSGNKAKLYGLDTNGVLLKTIKINAQNKDWEDLTMDEKGNLYIGDFGNNENNRTSLTILKIKAEDLASKQKEITPKMILFSYPEQKKFPPKKNKRHFDCEAFFYFKDSLYLFTKSRAPKHPEVTKLYQLPSKQGSYKAKYLSTFYTCNTDKCRVTAAAINPKGNSLALLSENAVFVLANFNTSNFSKLKNYYPFKKITQKESLTFKNDSTLYIADEYTNGIGGNLYQFSINSDIK